MDQHLLEILNEQPVNYILPFFWQHGEDEAILREEMQRIQDSNIGAVCIEARPHPDFGGPLWWRDLDIIMDEARQRGMRVWLLDDAHFPTGFANGQIRDKYPELAKYYLNYKQIDICGPQTGATVNAAGLLNLFDWMHPQEKLAMADEVLAVVAGQVDVQGQLQAETMQDLSAAVKDGYLHWDVPAGSWRVFVLIKTKNWGGNPDYINMVDRRSVRVLIDAVYETHYARYAADFGKTFAGFFSDEPSFGNTKGYNFDESIGRKKMVLPWSDELAQALRNDLAEDFPRLLPGLWQNAGGQSARVRQVFMDCATRLYDQDFAGQIGQWCRDHGVEYIGHVIEDQNVHARLGCGSGHFFRALAGQDMSGIDIIGNQVQPRLETFEHLPLGNGSDYEFFHFGLAKMGSSLGHIDPLKKGRTICEIFGASGWVTGVRNMKWITDHALVRGINNFVPHAFSAKEFPDPDCPPHFYARGNNPQYRFFGQLMKYTNRMCHLLNDGLHIAPVAILYHAEAEWSGDYMFFQKPAHWLTRSQIDFDVLPSDVFRDMDHFKASFDGQQLQVNGESFKCLVVPTSQYLTLAVASFIADAADQGFPTLFIDSRPSGISDLQDTDLQVKLLARLQQCPTVSLAELPDRLRALNCAEISLSEAQPYLRYYHYQRGGLDYYFLFNEHPKETIRTTVEFPQQAGASCYDAFANTISRLPSEKTSEGCRLAIELSAFESTLVVFGCDSDAAEIKPAPVLSKTIVIEGPWQLSLATSQEYPEFSAETKLDGLPNMSAPGQYPDFSGTFRYQTEFALPAAAEKISLSLGAVYEAVQVRVNGELAGSLICPPYEMDITSLVHAGVNSLQIEVTNTLVHACQDMMSLTTALEPSGLLGPVEIKY